MRKMRRPTLDDLREAFFDQAEKIKYENNNAILYEASEKDDEIIKIFPPLMDRLQKLKMRAAMRCHYYPYYEDYFDRYLAAAKSKANTLIGEQLLEEFEEELNTFDYHGYRWFLNIDLDKDTRYNQEKTLPQMNALMEEINTTTDNELKYRKINYLFINMVENYMALVMHPEIRTIMAAKIQSFEEKPIPHWLKNSITNFKKTILFAHLHPLFVEK